jgi:hypothetical protein
MILARDEAIEAGVDGGLMNDVANSFGADDIVALDPQAADFADRAMRITHQVVERLAGRGLSSEAADKAARAIVRRLLASRLVAEFAAELGSR